MDKETKMSLKYSSNETFNNNMFVSYLHVFYKIKKDKLRSIFLNANSHQDFVDRIKLENAILYSEIEQNADFSHPPTGNLEDINKVRRILGLTDLR